MVRARAGETRLPGTRAIGDRSLGHGENGNDIVGVADVEQHCLGSLAGDDLCLEVHDKEGLTADELFGMSALASETGEDPTLMVSKAHEESDEFFRNGDILDMPDRSHADVYFLEEILRNGKFDRRGCHDVGSIQCSGVWSAGGSRGIELRELCLARAATTVLNARMISEGGESR
jgi:hypothetical protein